MRTKKCFVFVSDKSFTRLIRYTMSDNNTIITDWAYIVIEKNTIIDRTF